MSLLYIVPLVLCLFAATMFGWIMWREENEIRLKDAVAYCMTCLIVSSIPILNIAGIIFVSICFIMYVFEDNNKKRWFNKNLKSK